MLVADLDKPGAVCDTLLLLLARSQAPHSRLIQINAPGRVCLYLRLELLDAAASVPERPRIANCDGSSVQMERVS